MNSPQHTWRCSTNAAMFVWDTFCFRPMEGVEGFHRSLFDAVANGNSSRKESCTLPDSFPSDGSAWFGVPFRSTWPTFSPGSSTTHLSTLSGRTASQKEESFHGASSAQLLADRNKKKYITDRTRAPEKERQHQERETQHARARQKPLECRSSIGGKRAFP